MGSTRPMQGVPHTVTAPPQVGTFTIMACAGSEQHRRGIAGSSSGNGHSRRGSFPKEAATLRSVGTEDSVRTPAWLVRERGHGRAAPSNADRRPRPGRRWETGLAIRYHVEQCWPASVEVAVAEQRLPLGTVHAVLAARGALETDRSFAVSNADDVYGEAATATQLATDNGEHALIGGCLPPWPPTTR